MSKVRKKKSDYGQVFEGELQPAKRAYHIACCDCGLVHRFHFYVKGRRRAVALRIWRDERKTAAFRRERKKRRIRTRRRKQ